ncbi:MAG: Tad domain-containing protein [Acidimicrobiia bacterium]|nr:Tad domain-containing protein [Acidimicrobiia bacterium]
MIRLFRRGIADESGVTMLVVSGSFVALMAIAAFVIDLGAVRMHRSEARAVVDAAATAGSLEVGEGNGQAGCATAAGYVSTNMGLAFAGLDCSTLASSCTASTAATTSEATEGDWKLTITYPVPDDHALMTSSAIGATSQSIVYSDGFRCERLGVNLERTHNTLFGRVLGQDKKVTDVHAVAVTRPSTNADTAVNLVILERYDCDALVAEGSGNGTGGIWVDVVVNPDGSISPGYATMDSDGTGAGCGADGVLDVDGLNAQIRADGPAGCPGQIGTHIGPGGHMVGEGCGVIQVLAPGTPGCNPLACTSSGSVNPDPTALGRRVTRAPIDHRYNCKASYTMPVGYEIRPCPDTPNPKIDNLIAQLGGSGTPAGYTSWTSLGHPCTIQGGPGTTAVADGNIYVDCADFVVKRNVEFTGGSVVFAGNVTIEGQGSLSINGTVGDPMTPGLDAVQVFVRNGAVAKAGQANFIAWNATMYMSSTSSLTMFGQSSGSLVWTAPTTGPFDQLALWSDSAAVHHLAGQAFLDLRGIFFTPDAQVVYQGNGVQIQIQAQFVARKLKVTGQGILILRPSFDSAVLIPDDIIALIR